MHLISLSVQEFLVPFGTTRSMLPTDSPQLAPPPIAVVPRGQYAALYGLQTALCNFDLEFQGLQMVKEEELEALLNDTAIAKVCYPTFS